MKWDITDRQWVGGVGCVVIFNLNNIALTIESNIHILYLSDYLLSLTIQTRDTILLHTLVFSIAPSRYFVCKLLPRTVLLRRSDHLRIYILYLWLPSEVINSRSEKCTNKKSYHNTTTVSQYYLYLLSSCYSHTISPNRIIETN